MALRNTVLSNHASAKGFELSFAPTPEAHPGANNHTDGSRVTNR